MRRFSQSLGALLALGCGGLCGPAFAEPAPHCAAIAGGALDLTLDREASTIRRAALKPGDRLTITFEAATAGPFGAVMLQPKQGEPRSLLVGPSGTKVSFTASRSGEVGLEFSKDGIEPAKFTASCVPARRGARHARQSERSASPLGEALPDADEFAIAELAGVVLDAGDLPAPRRQQPEPPARGVPEPSAPPGVVDMSMQWRGERFKAGGPYGLELDHSRSGIDAAVKYKVLPEIMVSALAQVDQPGESMINAPLDLSEQGWMAGPAATIKLAPNLSLDARAAWGVAESGADPLSARAVAVPRRAVSAKLASSQSFGAWRFSPSVSLNHFQVDSAAPGTEALEAGHAAGFGRVDVAPELAYRIDLDRSLFIEPRAVIGGFWTVDDLSKLAPASGGHGDMRFKAEAGVTVGAGDGTKLQATGGVEEGEPGAADVWSGRLQLSVPMK